VFGAQKKKNPQLKLQKNVSGATTKQNKRKKKH